jgi:hypothetical protein
MPYASEAQRRFFNANRKSLESEGVDVDEWNSSSRGKKLPEKKANTPGQTGNIPVTPPLPVRPKAAPSAHIPRPARRQTTLADMQGNQAMATQKVATPFFYLLGDLAKAAAQVKYARLGDLPASKPDAGVGNTALAGNATQNSPKPAAPFKGGPGKKGLGVPMTLLDRMGLGSGAADGTLQANLSNLASSVGDFATSPLGIGAGLGLGALGTGMYLGSRRKRDDDEKEAGLGALAKYAAGQSEAKRKSEANEIVDMNSIGGNVADCLSPFSWGGERAGRSQAMAEAAGDGADINVRHPGATSLLFGAGGGALGSSFGPAGAAAGSLAGVLLSGLMRRQEMQRINDLYDESAAGGKLKPKHPDFSGLSAAFLPLRGPHRTGQLEASRVMSGARDPKARRKDGTRDALYGVDSTVPFAGLLHGYAQNLKTQFASPSTATEAEKPEKEAGIKLLAMLSAKFVSGA